MSRFSKFFAIAFAAVAVAACGQKATINGVIEDAPSSKLVVKLLEASRYKVLDTISVNASGKFSYKLDVKEGDPDFVYLFYKNTRVANLLLAAGDKVNVTTDTLGLDVVIEGSEESVKYTQVEKDYAAVLANMAAMVARMESAPSQAEADAMAHDISNEYVRYYRNRLQYVLQNSKSLTVVPVLYQTLGDNLPLFAQSTDAIVFSNVADSLETVYPDSKYVKSLRKEAERRFNYMELQQQFASAEEIGFPDIELPDLNGQKQRLSNMDAKVVLLYFWSASQPSQNVFNVEVLKPVYEDYHSKGFDIYQVSLDVDKSLWATTVKGQELPWMNVCDSKGASSPYAAVYNIQGVPSAFVIADGELVDGSFVDEASFRKLLDKLLK